MRITSTVLVFALAGLTLAAQPAPSATYAGAQPDAFMTRWLVLSPIPVADTAPPSEEQQQRAFADDLLAAPGGEGTVHPAADLAVRLGTHDLTWRLVTSKGDAVDLDGAHNEFAVAYASAEIEMPEAGTAVLGIGSDDGVKVWLNGKLVHEKWVGRAVRPDEDLVGVLLRQGHNQLLLKIQNMRSDWGFACRVLGPDTRAKRLVVAGRDGDVETARLLLDHGTPANGHGFGGLTALQAAILHGRKDVVELLKGRGAETAGALPARDTLADALMRESFSADGPGAMALVARDGQVLFEKAYGLRDVEKRVAATPETEFRIGSVTKQFTAAAILKLQEQGKLSLDDTLAKYVADFPRGNEVTLRHLLTHTSGIHSYTSKPDFNLTATQATTPERLIAYFKDDAYDFAPGERWLYNNSGYFLLGCIVQKVSGEPYGEYLRKTFFAPLGMRSTGVHERTGSLPHEAMGYSVNGKDVARAADWNMSRAGGAGALYSTAHDLYLWNEALFGGKVVSAASLKAAFTPVVTSDEDPAEAKDMGYGYGFSIQRLRGARDVGHGGGLPGFSSYLLRLPDSRLTVVVLANSLPMPAGGDPGVIAHELAELFVGDQLPARETPRVDPAVSEAAKDAVAGSYDLGGATFVVTREGQRMFAQLGGQAKNEIFPRSATSYFLKERDREVAFVKNAQGQVTKAVITSQSGFSVTAFRKPEEREARVDAKAYDAYVGRYDYGGALMTVTREGDKLMAQLTGQPKFEIFPKSETTFFWKVVSAEVTFVKDGHGVVTKAVHKQGGQTIEAPRAAEIVEARVDPKLYPAYVGRYDYGQAVMTVTLEGERLFAQLAGQPKFEIFPKSETTFFWKVVNAEITFVKDASGAVVKGIHKQGGQTLEVKRLP